MLSALIRPVETTTIELIGESLEHLQQQIAANTPPGFHIASAPARMIKGSTSIETTATYRRVDSEREIEADDLASLEAQVPDGWRMLSVRAH